MLPDTPTPQQQAIPQAASLPAMPMQSQPLPTAVSPQAPGVSVPTENMSTEEAAERARRLVEQYEQAPYQLAEAFNQLKADYLQRQHHITSNPAGS